METQLENGLIRVLNFRGHTIDVSNQYVFTSKDSGLHDQEGKKFKKSDPLTTTQR